MSSSEDDEQGTKYKFKGKFGANQISSGPVAEASHEVVDAFVKQILGLTKDKGTESTEIES